MLGAVDVVCMLSTGLLGGALCKPWWKSAVEARGSMSCSALSRTCSLPEQHPAAPASYKSRLGQAAHMTGAR